MLPLLLDELRECSGQNKHKNTHLSQECKAWLANGVRYNHALPWAPFPVCTDCAIWLVTNDVTPQWPHVQGMNGDFGTCTYYLEFLPRISAVHVVLDTQWSCSVQVQEQKIVVRSGGQSRAVCDWTAWAELAPLHSNTAMNAKYVAGEGLHVRFKLVADSCDGSCAVGSANGDDYQSHPINSVSCASCLVGLIKEKWVGFRSFNVRGPHSNLYSLFYATFVPDSDPFYRR